MLLREVPLGSRIRMPQFFKQNPSLVVDVVALDGYGSIMVASKDKPDYNVSGLFPLDITNASRKIIESLLGINAVSGLIVPDLNEYKYWGGWISGPYKVELVNKIVDANKKCSNCASPIPHSEGASCAFCELESAL